MTILSLGYVVIIIWYKSVWSDHSETLENHVIPERAALVSIIIIARNEGTHITECLTSIYQSCQNYGPAEMILVDDHSEDDTITKAQQLQLPILRVLRLSDFTLLNRNTQSFKKAALHFALIEAKGDYILTTDADCTVPLHWVRAMYKGFQAIPNGAVTGPVEILSGDSRLLSQFESLELMGTMAGTKAGIKSGLYFSANAANMIYYKSDYLAFIDSHAGATKASGDDMFFVEWMSQRGQKVMFIQNREAIVKTRANGTLKDFISQRIRWATKTKAYKTAGIKVLMALVFMFHFGMISTLFLWIAGAGLLGFYLFAVMFFIKCLIDFILLRQIGLFFHKRLNVPKFPLMVGLHTVYIFSVGLAGLFLKEYYWKGRKVS